MTSILWKSSKGGQIKSPALSTYRDALHKTIAMHLMIGNQAIPAFSRGSGPIRDNDGIPDGWTIVVQEVSGWYGNIADPDRYRPATEGTK